MKARLLLLLLAGLGGTPVWASGGGQLAIIIDDIGYSAALGERSLALPGDFTYAVLPLAPHGSRLARQGAAAGKEIMVHNPMSNIQGLPLDAGALDGTMSRSDFLDTLDSNIQALPDARGLNNHMGSQLTQETEPMGWLMEDLAERGFYFIDSRTTAASRARETARRYRVPSLQRDVFLDHERDPEQIQRELERAIALAQRRGFAVAIGHPYPETLDVLEQLPAQLEEAGVELVFVSELLRHRPEAHWQAPSNRCPAPPKPLWHRVDPGPIPTDLGQLLRVGLPNE